MKEEPKGSYCKKPNVISFVAVYGDVIKNMELCQHSGGGDAYHLEHVVEEGHYWYGIVIKRPTGWVVDLYDSRRHEEGDKMITTTDRDILIDMIKDFEAKLKAEVL